MQALLTREQAADQIEALCAQDWPDEHKRVQGGFIACLSPPGLFEFCEDYAGMKDLGAFHLEVCDAVDAGAGNRLWLLPRGHFKSSLLSVANPLRRCLYHWPNQQNVADAGGEQKRPPVIFLISWARSLAIEFLAQIKAICEQPGFASRFWWALPSDAKKAPEWNTESITFSNGARIIAATLESLPTGFHATDIVADDLVTLDTVGTGEQIRKVKDRFSQLFSILNPGGCLDVVGTCYHHGDLYADLRGSANWETMCRPAVQDGKPLFPERFTLDALRLIEEEQGPYTFACQYMLNPVSDAEQIFRKEWIRMDCPDRVEGGVVTVACDPAISEKENACFTAIGAVMSKREGDGEKHRYLLDFIEERMGVSQTAQAIVGMAILHRAIEIGVEAIQYQAALVSAIEDEMRRRGVWFKVTPIKYHAQSKMDRIKLLQPDFAAGRYHLKPEHERVRQQLLDFPRGKHCDVIDMLALHDGLEAYKDGASTTSAHSQRLVTQAKGTWC